jgi:putative ABC transport system permease protein
VGGLRPYAWRSLAARPWRSLLTAVGVALGVAVLTAALVTSNGLDRAIDRTVEDVAGTADLTVSAFGETGLSADTIERLAALPGVAVAAPVIERRTYLLPSLDAGDWAADPVAVLGVDPAIDGRVRAQRFVVGTGLGSRTAPEALISQSFATASGLTVGDELQLFGAADAAPDAGRFTIVGVVAGDGPVAGAAGRVVVIPLERAHALFDIDGAGRVDLVATSQSALDGIRAALPGATGESSIVSTRADLVTSLTASTEAFRTTMALVAAIALFAGAFLIFNTLSMTVTERVREVALLRAAGAGRGQVARMVLLAATAIGVAGSLLGVLIGLGLAVVLGGFVRDALGLRTDVVPDAAGLGLALGLGILVTIAAAMEPALRAGRVPPVEALRRRASPGVEGRARLRWLVVVAAVVALAGVVLWPWPAGSTGDPAALRPLAVYGLLLVVALVVPFVLGPLARIAGIPFGWLLRMEERLARGALIRDRSRTALTVGALTIGLALVVAIGTVALDARRAASAWIDGVIPGDIVLSSVTPVDLGPDGPGSDLASLAGVARVSPVATFAVAHAGVRLDAAAVSGADLSADGRLDIVTGDRSSALAALDAGGAVIVPRTLAERLGLTVGSTLTLAGPTGDPISPQVVAVADRGFPGRGGEALLLGWADASSLGVTGADLLAVRYEPSAGADDRAAVERTARELGLQPVALERVEGAVGSALGSIFGLFDLLAVVAVVVAALGIVNTLSMDVVERVREIGILRATGMTRRQVARSVMVEAGMLGVVGAALGIATGLVAGVVMIGLAGGRLDAGLAIPWPTLLLALGLGVGLAMLAGYYPARLAGRQSIVRAVRAE